MVLNQASPDKQRKQYLQAFKKPGSKQQKHLEQLHCSCSGMFSYFGTFGSNHKKQPLVNIP